MDDARARCSSRARWRHRRRPPRRASPRRSSRPIRSRRGRTPPSAPRASPGPTDPGIPGNVTDTVVAMKASGENGRAARSRRTSSTARPDSKWLVFEPHGLGRARARRAGHDRPLRAHLGQRRARPRPARLDAPGLQRRPDVDHARHPLRPDVRRALPDQDLRLRQRPRPTSYFRLDITANHGATIIQLAELQLSTGAGEPAARARHAQPGRQRPARRLQRQGRRRLHRPARAALRRQAHRRRTAPTPTTRSSTSTWRSPPATRAVVRRSTPTSSATTSTTRARTRPSTCAFTDGTYLSDLHAVDQHGAELSPRGQGASKTLYTNQWNAKRSRIGAVAAGKTIDRILVAYDNPRGPHDFGGWIDDIDIGPAGPAPSRARPSDWVVTTRGTNSSGELLARQQHPRDRGPARLQLLDAGHQREHAELALRVPARQQRGQPAR